MKHKLVTALALVITAGIGVAGLSWWRAMGSRIDPRDTAQVEEGREVYAHHCAKCHGADLGGEPNWQTRKPNGELPAPPHDASGHTWHHTDEQLFALIKHGMARFAPPGYKTAMPSYVGVLSDSDIRAVLSYIESKWPPDIMERWAAMEAR